LGGWFRREELITRPLKQLEINLERDTKIVQRIWNFTSGHPNVVQRLCQRLVVQLNQRGDRYLTLSDVETVVADPDFLRKDFLNVYWERATALERLCTLLMATDENMRTLAAINEALIRRDIQVTLNQVDDALERLVDLRNILARTTTGYEFVVHAFPEVISRTARLDDLIALNCETIQQHGDVVPYLERGGK
jgi:stalled ribosome rescue protein Dom34